MSVTPETRMGKIESAMGAVSLCRDMYIGATRILTEKYLPKWDGEGEDQYKVRLACTAFQNLYEPIVSGVAGMATKKEPSLAEYESFNLLDVDLKGSGLWQFVKDVAISSMVAGIEFVAVETSEVLKRSFFKRYAYEQLWAYRIDGDEVTQLVFRETIEIPSEEAFGMELRERYVVFAKGGGEVWYDSGDGVAKQSEWFNSLDEVPVYWVATGKEISRFEYVPKFYDIAKLNVVSTNFESQLGNVLSIVGNPVPVFYGEVDEGEDGGVKIGVRDALVFTDRSTEGFEYVEITGAGVDKIESKIKGVNDSIDKLAFSLLQRSDSATVIDAQSNQSKNTSFLTDVAVELESCFNKLFRWADVLDGSVAIQQDARIEFKKDFDDVLFSDSQLTLMKSMVDSGDLSRETLWEKMIKGAVLPADFDVEMEKQRIADEVGNGI